MSDAILIFTFSPVQSFIAEARRAADLYTGSQILVELARAAGQKLAENSVDKRLIYPADLNADIPNKLVACAKWDSCANIAESARQALFDRSKSLAEEARNEFLKTNQPFEDSIWQRQTEQEYLWEIYWTAVSIDGRSYHEAYLEAERALHSIKKTRPFKQAIEPGFKDTLSGKRQALCTDKEDGNAYWFSVGNVPEITPIKIRPSTENRPRERLDALGLIKRFHPLAEKSVKPFHGFPSTSSIASASFLESAYLCESTLKAYHDAISALLPEQKYKIRDDAKWPYDGDLFFRETLTPNRLSSDYGKKGLTVNHSALKTAKNAQKNLFAEVKKANKGISEAIISPSPYYAIVMLDGDNMGDHLRNLPDLKSHQKFSSDLYKFSIESKQLAEEYLAKIIYNSGDDVLAMAPLNTAFAFAHALATTFHEITCGTASAGIAISHHLSPLSHALQTAREAETLAKQIPDKNGICIIALKRGGEPIEVRSTWAAVGKNFEQVIEHILVKDISSKLPYDVANSAYALPQADDKFAAELDRLLKRHSLTKSFAKNRASSLAMELSQWAASFPSDPNPDKPQPTDQLAGWLKLARFFASGGRE
jgi:CRISPR-associated protein Cmr2